MATPGWKTKSSWSILADMSERLNEDLPEALRAVRTRPLFVVRLDVPAILDIGATPGPNRRVGVVSGGVFEGERLSGVVLGSGADWQSIHADGAATLDVRLVLKTSDGALIGMTYAGVRHGPAEVMAKIASGQTVDPSAYYFRTAARFETAAPGYDWLNRIVAVGVGDRRSGGPVYSLFEVL